MKAVILRRRKLGRTSCKEIQKKSACDITVVRSDKPFPMDADIIFRWGCTADIPHRGNAVVVNKAKAIHQVNDKGEFRALLDEHDLCPPTFFKMEDVPYELVDSGMVVRPKTHSRGRNLVVTYNDKDLKAALLKFGDGAYCSSLIRKESEYRVFVVQGRVVCVAEKFPGKPDDVAWNVARGGRFENVRWDNWPLKAVRYAVEAFDLTELDFGGVDVMVDIQGNPYVIEINSAPSLTSEYRQTCFAKAFDYIINNGNHRLGLVEEKGGYKKFIHPAVCEDARMRRA